MFVSIALRTGNTRNPIIIHAVFLWTCLSNPSPVYSCAESLYSINYNNGQHVNGRGIHKYPNHGSSRTHSMCTLFYKYTVGHGPRIYYIHVVDTTIASTLMRAGPVNKKQATCRMIIFLLQWPFMFKNLSYPMTDCKLMWYISYHYTEYIYENYNVQYYCKKTACRFMHVSL